MFQPIWDFAEGTLLGVEALMHPDPAYGLSGSGEAFDIAEQLGRVHQLDMLCFESALRAVPELDPGVLLFINLSPHTLDLDSARNDWVRAAVQAAGLSPSQVVIEVTERFGGRTAAVVKCLRRLREQGFKTALDNVGTGNSGLEMLRSVDAEFVKLDPSIVIAAPTDASARAVLLAMATFACQTGAFVIAEGVEDEETLDFLRGDRRPRSARRHGHPRWPGRRTRLALGGDAAGGSHSAARRAYRHPLVKPSQACLRTANFSAAAGRPLHQKAFSQGRSTPPSGLAAPHR